MKEILFRGKTSSGEWIYGSHYTYGSYTWIIPNNPQKTGMTGYEILGCDPLKVYGAKTVDPKTVGQCTGLNDKAIKRIFEGDVIMDSYYPEANFAEIIYYNGCYRLKDTVNGIAESLEEVHESSNIIGNIYDNPELLGG